MASTIKTRKNTKTQKKIAKIDYRDLMQLFEKSRHEAGIHQILDPVAIKILQKTNIKTIIVNGYNPQNIQHAIEGKKIGTIIME